MITFKVNKFVKSYRSVTSINLAAFERNSDWRYSLKKFIPKNFAKLTGKHQCLKLFLIELQHSGLQLYEKRDFSIVIFV